jgi:phage terminase small subunit
LKIFDEGAPAPDTSAITARANVTAESLMDQAETILTCAMKSGQLSAAVSALKEKGVLSGHRIERKEVGPAGAFDALTDYELERAHQCDRV